MESVTCNQHRLERDCPTSNLLSNVSPYLERSPAEKSKASPWCIMICGGRYAPVPGRYPLAISER